MGIKNLKKIISVFAKGCIQKCHISNYNGKIIGIDTSIYLYRFSYFGGNPYSSIVMQAIKLMKNGVVPLYIFDGKPPKEKEGELINRTERKKEMNEKQEIITKILNKEKCEVPEKYKEYADKSVEELNDELQMICNSNIVITSKIKEDVRKILDYMGVPYLVAEGEAEVLCAKLNQAGFIYGCLSEDTDILANGGRIFIRGYSNSSNYVEEYNANILLTELGFTFEQFIDMCILCGCDYTGTISGIGYINAYKYIKDIGNIERIIERYCGQGGKRNSDDCDYRRVREMFLGTKIDLRNIRIELQQPNVDELLKFLGDLVNEKTSKYIRKNLVEAYWKLKDIRV